jgi:Uma2 family endonuclease
MNVALRRPMTTEEFLAWEERQSERWEFDGLKPIATVGGAFNHSLISGNVFAALRQHRQGGPCRAHVKGLKINAADSIRYPDVFGACGPTPGKAIVANNPVVVLEVIADVIAPSTMSTDMIVKSREYQATPSIMRHVLVAQDGIAIEMHTRRGEDGIVTFVIDPEASLDMPEIDVTVPIATFYEGIAFES